MDKIYIVLGNGFSIDLIQKMNRSKEIDLSNLFSKGEYVEYPKTKNKGFLSRKYTPALWDLGARSYMSCEDAVRLITDIITCANVYNLSREKRPKGEIDNSNIYINAYMELTSYLRYLFIYYNSLISDSDLNNILEKINLVRYIKQCISNNQQVYIYTYNYDVFLERILLLSKITFDIYGFTHYNSNIIIFKPHGSISFSFNKKIEEYSSYNIKNSFVYDSIAQNASDFDVKYNLNCDYPIVNAIIPPAGDSSRFHFGWIKDIRKGIDETIGKSDSNDKMLLFGISYWHVDRNEIDEILLSMNNDMEVRFINPNPPTSLDAVLSSLFKNYILFTHDRLLEGEIYND